MKVAFHPNTITYTSKLVDILCQKHYFSYPDSAIEYVYRLKTFCEVYIPLLPGKKAPERFKKYGRDLRYLTYRPNKQTTWYLFYIQKNDRFIVTYITNNHVNAHHIRGLR